MHMKESLLREFGPPPLPACWRSAVPTGAWYDPDDHGDDQHVNPNVLTRDVGTSLIGQGSSAHTTLVEVEKVTPTS